MSSVFNPFKDQEKAKRSLPEKGDFAFVSYLKGDGRGVRNPGRT